MTYDDDSRYRLTNVIRAEWRGRGHFDGGGNCKAHGEVECRQCLIDDLGITLAATIGVAAKMETIVTSIMEAKAHPCVVRTCGHERAEQCRDVLVDVVCGVPL